MNKFLWRVTSFIYNKLGPKNSWKIAMGPIPSFFINKIIKKFGKKMLIVRVKYSFLIKLTLGEFLTGGFLHLGETNPNETRVVRKIIEDQDVFFDVGGYIGWYSLNAAQLVGKNGKVFAFEPNPKIAKKLRVNCEINGLKNVDVQEIALSNNDGLEDFWIGKNGMLGSLKKQDSASAFMKIKVKTMKIDTFCRKKGIKNIKLIKIDAEGSDLEIIDGAKKTLEEISPFLILEVYGSGYNEEKKTDKKIINYLLELGYKPYEFTENKLKLLKKNQKPQLINLFFAKDEKVLRKLDLLK